MSAQPKKGDAAEVQGNPISKDSKQQSESNSGTGQRGQVESRQPQNQTMGHDQASSTASGAGVRGGGAGENPSDVSQHDQGKSHVDEAQQLGAAGEGQTADAVKGGGGGGGGMGGNKHSAGA